VNSTLIMETFSQIVKRIGFFVFFLVIGVPCLVKQCNHFSDCKKVIQDHCEQNVKDIQYHG